MIHSFSDKIVFAKTTKKSGGTMNHYNHFTLKDREMIKHYLDIGKNQLEIAVLLRRSKSSISRELKRNSLKGEYFPKTKDINQTDQ